MMILYGIPTCDTCKKALKTLEGAGHSVAFRDVRADPLTDSEVAEFVREFGDRIVNRQSTTYRAFSEFLKNSDADEQLKANPAVMKRPVIRANGQLHLGWDTDTQTALLK